MLSGSLGRTSELNSMALRISKSSSTILKHRVTAFSLQMDLSTGPLCYWATVVKVRSSLPNQTNICKIALQHALKAQIGHMKTWRTDPNVIAPTLMTLFSLIQSTLKRSWGVPCSLLTRKNKRSDLVYKLVSPFDITQGKKRERNLLPRGGTLSSVPSCLLYWKEEWSDVGCIPAHRWQQMIWMDDCNSEEMQ